MEVEYALTLQDIAAFLGFHLRHRPKLRQHPLVRMMGMVWALGIVVLAGLAGWFFTQRWGTWLSGCCTGVVVGVLLTVVVFGWLQSKVVIQNTIRPYDREECRWFFARRRLKITADGFEMTNEYQQIRYSWSVVWLIESTKKHAFIYTMTHIAHIIPRHGFRDEQHFEAFIDLACRYHKGLPPRDSIKTEILDALPVEQTGITRPRQL